MKKTALTLFAGLALMATSCKKDKNEPTPQPQPTETKTAYLTTTANPAAGGYTGFNFATGAEVNPVDASATNWDFALLFVTMKVNSNASGAGQAGVQILNQPLAEVMEAPESGYAYDTTATQLAVKGSAWYTYNPSNHTFAPIAGKTFVFKTADGKYAKMEMIEALPVDNDGNVVTPPTMPSKIKYKINYNYQADGSRKF